VGCRVERHPTESPGGFEGDETVKGSAVKYIRWGIAAVGLLLLLWIVIDSDTRAQFVTGSGIAQGALVAAIALGVVLTYRGSGVVNFANSAIAMYIAYVYAVLRKEGDLFLPPLPNPFAPIEGVVHWFQDTDTFDLPDWPTRISFGPNMQFWPAMLISLIFAILLGLILHFLIFRPLRSAPPLAKVVASIGLFLYLPAVIIRRFTIQPYTVKPMPFFDNDAKPVKLPFGISIGADALTIAVLVVIFTVLLWVVFQMTRFGLATRAASENEKGAVVLGFSPEFLAGANWVISTLITGLLGIFAATIQKSIDPAVLPALIVPALTAALVGSFTSFGLTAVAAFALGMQFGLVKYLEIQHSWFPSSGGTPLPGGERFIPLLVIVLVLYLSGKSLPTRGAISAGRLPFSPTPPRWAIRYGGPALALATAILALFVLTPPFRLALSNTLIGVIICLSLVVLTGYVGQISLAQMSFAGISAFLVSKMTMEAPIKIPLPFSTKMLTIIPETPFPIPIIIGGIVAMLVGIIVAIPALRVRGVNLAIVTLAFAVAVDKVVFANKSVNGGFAGAQVEAPQLIVEPRDVSYKILGMKAGDGLQPNPMTAIFCLIVVVILAYAVANLRRSATGRRMLATRSNERAAAAAGVNVSGMKILAFAVSAFIAGVGGAVIAYRSGSVTVDKFTYVQSLTFLAFAYIGGITSVYGAISGGFIVAGGLVFTFLERILHVPSEFTLILGGIGLIFSAIMNPEGLAGAVRHTGAQLKALIGLRKAQATPPPGAPPAAEPELATTAGGH
jgi:branched-chain amino acid transport system permease protein